MCGFFNLFNMAEIALFNRTGFTIGTSEVYSVSPAALGWQGFGAFVAIVLGGIWVAREHLRGVWRTALGKDNGVSDRDEIMKYRTALIGIALGVVYILFWLTRIGIHPGVALLLLFAVVTLYLGLTRIVIEGGLVFVRGPLVPQAYAMHLIGPADLTGSTMTGLGLSYGWACDPIATFMPFGANAARVHSERRFPQGVYLSAVGLALGISLIVSFYFSLKLAYSSGAYNFGEWVFRRGGQVPYDTVGGENSGGRDAQSWSFCIFWHWRARDGFADVSAPSVRMVALASYRVFNCFRGTSEVDPVVAICCLGG